MRRAFSLMLAAACLLSTNAIAQQTLKDRHIKNNRAPPMPSNLFAAFGPGEAGVVLGCAGTNIRFGVPVGYVEQGYFLQPSDSNRSTARHPLACASSGYGIQGTARNTAAFRGGS